MKLAHAKRIIRLWLMRLTCLEIKSKGFWWQRQKQKAFKKRIKELEDFLKAANHELTEYDESMVRKYIEKIKVYEDKFTVCFKAGVDLDIER